MYKAVFLDMDGTLLKKDHSVGPLTHHAIARVMDRGIPVILVSARPLDGMLPIARSLQTDSFPVVSLNGGYIVEGEKVLQSSSIDMATTRAITEKALPHKATPVYYRHRQWYAPLNNAWVKHEQRILATPVELAPVAEILTKLDTRPAGPNKILLMGEAPQIALAWRDLQAAFPTGLHIFPSKPTYLEILDPLASKENAIRFLLGRLGIDPREIIAIGDNYNDKNMIAFAGMGVAMGNAPDEIKAVAKLVTDTNQKEGVGLALNKLIP